MAHYLVDGNNVVGSRPDGWWRDRRGATERLIDTLAVWAREQPGAVTVVFDGQGCGGKPHRSRAPGEGHADLPANLTVAFAGPGRSADDEIAERAGADPDPASLVVVTSDTGLAARLPPTVTVLGSGSFGRRIGR